MPQPTKISRHERCRQGDATISLICMFQIVTGCCVFFACLRVSIILTVLGTLVATPAIIRTGMASQIYQTRGLQFGWTRRFWCFTESIGVVLFTALVSAVTFALTSVGFGLFCVLIALVAGSYDVVKGVAIIGTVGGMAWGAAGAMVAMGYCARTWKPKLETQAQDN